MTSPKKIPLSAYGLIAANMIPLFGVLFFDWDAILILGLYWIENLIIGGFNVIKMLIVSAINKQLKGVFLSAFFVLHFGAFCAAHGQLLVSVLGLEIDVVTPWSGPLAIFQDGFVILQTFIMQLAPSIWLGITVLALSRLTSFIENFLLRGECFSTNVNKLMAAPYAQILVMHVGLMFGAVLLQTLGSPVWMLALIVFLKMVVDYKQFNKRHINLQTQNQTKDF